MSRTEKAKTLLLLAGIFLLMLALNIHTPLMMDDYDYSFSWSTGKLLDGIRDILDSQAAHYRLWGGRSVTHFLAQLFLYLGKPVFNVFNTAMYCLLLMEICALSGNKEKCRDWRCLLLVHAGLFFLTSFFGVAFLWLDGACNYLWGTALALVPLLITVSERKHGYFDAGWRRGWLALPLSLIAGWTNENTACGILASMVLLLIWDRIQDRKIRGWRIAAVIMQGIGTALLLLAPGNFARAAEESSRGIVMELVYRFAVTSYCLFRYCGVILLILLAAVLAARKKRVSVEKEWLCVLSSCVLLSAYSLVGSPQISDRSFTAVICLSIAALILVLSGFELKIKWIAVLFAVLVCAIGGVSAWKDICIHEAAWSDQLEKISAAVENGDETAEISSVPSVSRYTMSVIIEKDPQSWPNSTIGKYYGILISGEE